MAEHTPKSSLWKRKILLLGKRGLNDSEFMPVGAPSGPPDRLDRIH